MDFQVTLRGQRLEIWSTGAFLGELPPTLETQIESFLEARGWVVWNRSDDGQSILVVDLPLGVDGAALKEELLRVLSPNGPDEVAEDDDGEIATDRSLSLPPDLW